MKYTLLRLATAFVAFSISAHAAEVFYVKTLSTTYPATSAASFNAATGDDPSTTGPVQVDGVDYTITADDIANGTVTIGSGDSAVVYLVSDTATVGDTLEAVETGTNPYNIYGTTDTGSGTGVHTNQNFNGLSSAINPGDQVTQGSNTTTYFGPKFYVGINREHQWKVKAGVFHSNGNGYRIKADSVNAADIGTAQVGVEGDTDYAAATGNGGEPINTRALFMFDADTSSLTAAADDSLIFNDTDTLTAKLSVPGTFNARASRGTFRPMVKADGQYYAGTLWEVPADHPDSSTLYTISETGADTNWILMPNLETGSSTVGGETNLIVDTSVSATTVPGKYLTNITQVGFLLETDTVENTGGYNYGVREYTANASSVYAPHPSGIEWTEDFISDVNGDGNFLTTANSKVYDGAVDPANLLTGDTHAFKWSTAGAGLTATPASTVTQSNNQVVLELNSRDNAGLVELYMIGPGTDNSRRVKPVSHEVTFNLDLIEWRNGQADLIVQTRGHDGYVRSTLSPSGTVKYTTWMSNYSHTNFDNFNGPSSLRNNTNNPGIVIVDGGIFDPASADPVEVTISGNAVVDSVNMNSAGDAVESVDLSNYGSGYTALPTVVFSGGGMTVAPTVSFNFETGNINRQNVVTASMRDTNGDYDGTNSTLELPGTLLNDGQVLTYIQSYDNADDSISYYYSLDGSDPQFITKLTAADHSPGGHGFFDVSTGNKWGQPNNQQAVWFQYKQWGNPGGQRARVGINSVSVATSDDDRDGVVNRNDAFPSNPYETADSDSDGVGDVSDAHPGYDDAVVAAINTAAQSAGDSTFSYYVTGNADSYSYSVGGGAITQEAYDAVVAEKVAAETAQATAETNLATAQTAQATAEAARDTAQTALNNAREARPGSTVIDVANDVATITLTIEQTSDVSDWSSATTSNHDIDLSAPAGASFYRFNYPEE